MGFEAVTSLSRYISITKFTEKEKTTGTRVAIHGQLKYNIAPFAYES